MSACIEHPCDSCAQCLAGGCCGEAVVTLDLPRPGAFALAEGTEFGELAVRDGLVMCHVCGEWFRSLGGHVATHGLTADAYRSAFDLLATQGLQAEPREATYHPGDPRALADWNATVTSEQRSLIQWHRARRGASKNPRLSPARQQAFALKSAARRRADPELERSIRIRVRRAHRHEDEGQRCPECGAWYCTWTSRAGRTVNKARTCGQDTCVRAARSRAARTRWAA